jgi:hypothetical protein
MSLGELLFMAYDPNDAADKAIVAKLVQDALDEANETHETEIEGLRTKNRDLIGKLKKAREGADNGDSQAEVDRLELELAENKKLLKDTTKSLKVVETERDNHKNAYESEAAVTRNLIVDNGLTEALVTANVAPHFLPAVKAMLASQVKLEADGDNRKAVIGDKSLSDFVKDWSQGDTGKHYIAAPANGGGGSSGGGASGGSKKIMEMSEPDRVQHFNKVGKEAFESQLATETNAA